MVSKSRETRLAKRPLRTVPACVLLSAVLGCNPGGASVAPPDPAAPDGPGQGADAGQGLLEGSQQSLTSESVKLK